ncbi:malonyl-CoA:ACP transacylase [Ochromonadaceae sp. CCMP2298]|nr:malonyl-CoA:ACP transacylase [Ochromonadaceae sp. CCMP2298]
MAAVSYKVGFMFPGQGAQSVGMAVSLCSEVPAAKALFDTASEILGYDLLAKCADGPKESLDSTVISQPAIFVASMAALEKLKADDPEAIGRCTVAMGLSLGEYTALCFAGAFSFEDGVRLTKARGEAMQAAADASESGMVAVIGLSKEAVQQICDKAAAQSGQPISIANYLVDGNYAVSGAKEACAAVLQIAPEMGARMALPLSVAGAFHTAFMQPAVESLKVALAAVEIKPPRLPVVSNVDAMPHYDPEEIRDILARQVTSPVQWESIVTAMVKAEEFETAYEIGPGMVCRGIVKRFGKKTPVVSVTV